MARPLGTPDQVRIAVQDHDAILERLRDVLGPLMNQPAGSLAIAVKNADGTYGIRTLVVGPGASLVDSGTTLTITVP